MRLPEHSGAIMRLKNGSAHLLLYGGVSVLLVATFAHVVADSFLQFESVQVGSESVKVLGLQTADAPPSYSFIGDKSVVFRADPQVPVQRALFDMDAITQGLSRFSILPESVDIAEFGIFPGPLNAWVFDLTDARSVPGTIGVQCSTNTTSVIEGGALESGELIAPIGDGIVHDCDYERDI